MKRDILATKRMKHISGCCPGHDQFPTETYGSRRSKRARSRDKAIEHRVARSIGKRLTKALSSD